MKKSLIVSALMFLALAEAALGSQIGDLPWNRQNIERLRSFDKAAVVSFVNEWSGNTIDPITTDEIREYEWADLTGDGKYDLVLTDSSGPCCIFLAIYTREDSGKVTVQTIEGARKLSKTVRDLDGDDKDELIIWTELLPLGWAPMAATPRWPAVYRLENGKYVEASRDFPNFYDQEILPQLDKEIIAAQQRVDEGRGYAATVAFAELEKDKIMRVLGRDPTAGLQQAYQWLDSGDSQQLQCAIATFQDIGGHEKELAIAKQALQPAIQREQAARNGG
jgi:hypothetical protein